MALSFLTNLDEAEFKEFLKEALKEILAETLPSFKEETPDILNVEQAANFLRLKITTVYEKTSRKIIPHFKKGNKLYFRKDELKAWLEEGKVKTARQIAGEAATYTLLNSIKSK